MSVVRQTYQVTLQLPKHELFGLRSQMQRAAVSLPTNVAEGFRRRNPREFSQFLHVALGSAAELETHIEICQELHGLQVNEAEALRESLGQFQAMTMTLIKQLRKRP